MITQKGLSKNIAESKGRKIKVNVTQIREIQYRLLHELSGYYDQEILDLIHRVRKGEETEWLNS